MPDLHQLQIYRAVVENGSYTQAARQLFLTQPSVSAQVARLREFVGLPILVRDGRGVKPTAAGLALYQYATEVLAATGSLQHRVSEIESGEVDHLVIGANAAYGTFVLPAALARIHANHPRMRLSLVQGLNREIVRQVRGGSIDLAVIFSEQVPEELPVTNLGADEIVLVEASVAPFSGGKRLTLGELAQLPFIRSTMNGPNLTHLLERQLRQQGLGRLKSVMELPTWTATREAARAGVGIAIGYRSIVQPDLENEALRIVEVDGYHDERNVLLVCSRERRAALAPAFKDVLDRVQAHMAAALKGAS